MKSIVIVLQSFAIMRQIISQRMMWLVLLTPSIWHLSVGNPVQPVDLNANTCVTLVCSLFSNITGVLAVGNLFKGLNCTGQIMELNARTPLTACAPYEAYLSTTCSSHMFTFDREACLLNILEDLSFYRTALQSHSDYDLIFGPTVLKSIDHLMQDCFSSPFVAHTQKVLSHPENTFDERLRLCKTLWGFHTRTITINRIIRYILNRE